MITEKDFSNCSLENNEEAMLKSESRLEEKHAGRVIRYREDIGVEFLQQKHGIYRS